MARIGVIIADEFEDDEYLLPAVNFRNAGHEVVHIGTQKDNVEGKKGTMVPVEISFDMTSARDYDALLIPGGHSPERLLKSGEAVNFVGMFVKSGKPVFAICHGPQLLAAANVLGGRKVTGTVSIENEIRSSGAVFVDAEVVEDGNIVTSRGPADIPAFIKASLKKIKKE